MVYNGKRETELERISFCRVEQIVNKIYYI